MLHMQIDLICIHLICINSIQCPYLYIYDSKYDLVPSYGCMSTQETFVLVCYHLFKCSHILWVLGHIYMQIGLICINTICINITSFPHA